MTIRKGEEWGNVVEMMGVQSTRYDRDLIHGLCAPVSGDLALTIGVTRAVEPTNTLWRQLPVDRLRVVLDDLNEHTAVAHVQIGTWWRQRFVIISNVAFLKGVPLFSRSHPNDGKCEVFDLDAAMSLRQRFIAFQRRRTLSHLPHPQLTTTQTKSVTIEVPSRVTIRIDARRVAKARKIHVEVIPDAGFVYIASSAI